MFGSKQMSGKGIANIFIIDNITICNGLKKYPENLMSHKEWNLKEACRLSGLSRPRLYALLKKHDITRNKRSATS
jgi:hypothetical protein